MLRPSRPMMRPLRSSLGRSTTDTVVSIACSAALRWMASVMICCARGAAVSRASVSRRLTRLAASRRASASICLRSRSRASSAREAGDALELALLVGDELLGAGVTAAAACCSWLTSAFSRRRRSCSSRSVREMPVGERSRLVGQRSARGAICLAAFPRLAFGLGGDVVGLLLAPRARLPCGAVSASRSRLASMRAPVRLGAPDRLGRDARRFGDPPERTPRPPRRGRRRRSRRMTGNDPMVRPITASRAGYARPEGRGGVSCSRRRGEGEGAKGPALPCGEVG